jgi:hypothetical protein
MISVVDGFDTMLFIMAEGRVRPADRSHNPLFLGHADVIGKYGQTISHIRGGTGGSHSNEPFPVSSTLLTCD